MKYESQYYEPLIMDEAWVSIDGKLIKVQPEEKEEVDSEDDTQGQ